MNRAAWLAERRTGIGGSDAAACLGLSPWMSPFELYLDKIGERQSVETEAMYWGSALQDVITRRYADLTGNSVYVPPTMLRHPQHNFMLANLDGIASDDVVFEGKTARTSDGWGEPGSDEIPDSYAIQCQHYMAVTGLKGADVAVLIGGSDFRIYHMVADREIHAALIEAEQAFWRRVVERDPPPPRSHADVKLRWPRSTGDFATPSEDVLLAIAELKEAKANEKAWTEEIDRLEAAIKAEIGERDGLAIGDEVFCTWKSNKKASDKFDVEAFRKSHPKLYAKFAAPGAPQRRFLLK